MEAGILTRTLHILNNIDPTVELALINHKKLKVDETETNEDELNNSNDLAKKSLHDLSQVIKLIIGISLLYIFLKNIIYYVYPFFS